MPKKNRIGAYCKSSGMKINRLDFVSAHHGIPLIVSSLSVERNERTRLNPGSHVSFLFVQAYLFFSIGFPAGLNSIQCIHNMPVGETAYSA